MASVSADDIRDVIRISCVVIHPKYRTIGSGAKIVAETLPYAGRPYVETIAVMAKYGPFFEKAGMPKIAETTPQPSSAEGCGEAETQDCLVEKKV